MLPVGLSFVQDLRLDLAHTGLHCISLKRAPDVLLDFLKRVIILSRQHAGAEANDQALALQIYGSIYDHMR